MSIAGQAGEVSRQAVSFVEGSTPVAPMEIEAEAPTPADAAVIGRAVGNAILEAVAESSAATPLSRRVVKQAGEDIIVVDGQVLQKPRPVNTSPTPVHLTRDNWNYGPPRI